MLRKYQGPPRKGFELNSERWVGFQYIDTVCVDKSSLEDRVNEVLKVKGKVSFVETRNILRSNSKEPKRKEEFWNKENKQSTITISIQRKEKNRKEGRERGREEKERKEKRKEVLAFG